MATTRNVVRVFLASPGDLGDERKAAKAAVDNLNRTWANAEGYHVELIGWEDTIGRSGRPQNVINQDLATCELFIGMMWTRWGSPPDNSGPFTSGFQEEFALSTDRRRRTGEPEIRMFFKKVPEALLRDPGDQLKKVLEFKETIVSEKTLLFEQFDDLIEFRDRLFACVSHYIQLLRDRDREKASEKNRPADQAEPAENTEAKHEALSEQGRAFLSEFIEQISTLEGVYEASALSIARFRLLAASIRQRSGEKIALDVHDANVLFANRRSLELGAIERSGLISAGLKNIKHENTPLWLWLANLANYEQFLILESQGGADAERAGALTAMRLLGVSSFTQEFPFDRGTFLGNVLAEGTHATVKAAALEFLGEHGLRGDLPQIQTEVERANHGTVRQAIEAVIRIRARNNYVDAFHYAVNSGFETIGSGVTSILFARMGEVGNPDLISGLAHRCPQIRVACARELRSRALLDPERALKLTTDSDGWARFEGLLALRNTDKKPTHEAAKEILIKPQRTLGGFGFGLLGNMRRDEVGEERYEEFLHQEYARASESELARDCGTDPLNEAAYYAYQLKFFESNSRTLRRDVDDKYGTFFDQFVTTLEAKFGQIEVVEKYRKLGDHVRKKLLRVGLNVLLEKGDNSDAVRVRSHLRDKFADPAGGDFLFLGKHGAWDDIDLVASIAGSSSNNALTSLLYIPAPRFIEEAAASIYALGKNRISELLSLQFDPRLLRELIMICAETKFATLNNILIMRLLSDDNEQVRRATAIMCVQSLPKRRLEELLNAYSEKGGTRYYNVSFWLDCGLALPRTVARQAARRGMTLKE